jgi:hypothetical protein
MKAQKSSASRFASPKVSLSPSPNWYVDMGAIHSPTKSASPQFGTPEVSMSPAPKKYPPKKVTPSKKVTTPKARVGPKRTKSPPKIRRQCIAINRSGAHSGERCHRLSTAYGNSKICTRCSQHSKILGLGRTCPSKAAVQSHVTKK